MSVAHSDALKMLIRGTRSYLRWNIIKTPGSQGFTAA